ncbi:hypothetical protein ACIG0A_33395 [Streptomyces californicus]|uniref:hypothetical protein n=1 Tax=Streptomyces californicus TaxID=67351 RepID=UPI0037D25645
MNEATIGLITGLSAALIALGAAVWTNAKAGRRQERLQQAQWRHDRRRDAYLAFSRAARAFVPLTEEMFLLEARAGAAVATSPTEELPTDTDDERMVFQFTWHDALASDPFVTLSDEWKERAPLRLQELTAAHDGVNLEGPPEIADVAYSIVATAHRLFVGMPLFEMEAKDTEAEIKKAGEEDKYEIPSALDYLNSEVSSYFRKFADFRGMAKEKLTEAEDE